MRRKLIIPFFVAIVVAASAMPATAGATNEPVPIAGTSAFRWYVSGIDGSYQPYGVYIPTSYSSVTPSGIAIAGLHGWGGTTTKSFSSFVKDWANTNNTILVSLQGRGNQNWDSLADEDMFAVLADVRKDYSTVAGRLYLEGCSMGGTGTYRWALRYPDLFAAAAPQAGWTSYEDFYFKWYAGLGEDVGHWGYANGDNPPVLSSAQFANASRKPLMEAASARYQIANAKYASIMMNSSSGDPVNQPQNAQWIRDGLVSLGYTVNAYPWTGSAPQFVWRQVSGGHCASRSESAVYPFFVGKTAVVDPASPVYTTNTLKFNKAYWVQIDRLQYANQWAKINPTVTSQHRIDVDAANVTQYTLSLDANLVDMSAPVEIYTNGMLSYSGPPHSTITLYAALSASNSIESWSTTDTLPGGLHKTHAIDGPIGDAVRQAFTVVYGTSGSSAQTAQNLADAQQFVRDWNAVMIQNNTAWGFPGAQVYLSPIPDSAVTPAIIHTRNLRLFGDQSSNSIVAEIQSELPVTLLDNGINVGGRNYQGGNVRYTLVYPNPLNPDRYVVLGKGYLAETLIAGTTLGKDLERLPWGEPDYVVWDASRVPGPTVQNPDGTIFRHLPDTYLEAGFFDENWSLDNTAPITTMTTRTVDGGVEVTLAASDNLGGFGVSLTQYRLDGGAWTTYLAPFTVGLGIHTVEYRSSDSAGRDTSPQGVVPNNTEMVKSGLVVVGGTALTYTGATTSDFNDPATVSAKLVDGGGNGVAGEPIVFTLNGTETCTGTTDASGSAACSITPGELAGDYTLTANFAGDVSHMASSASAPFTVTLEETTLSYTGPTLIANGQPVTLSGVLMEDGTTPVNGRTVVFTLGSGSGAQSCNGTTDAAGSASCTIDTVNQPLGLRGVVTAAFASDGYYQPASASASTLLFAFVGQGSFVIGDLNSAVGTSVTFWGAQWWKLNYLTGGAAPASFKGFALNPTTPQCGIGWSTGPGNSAPPLAGPLPAFIGVIVSSSISKSGSEISGDTPHIVVVQTNPDYDANPGHAGTGTVVGQFC